VKDALESSKIGHIIADLAKKHHFEFSSKRQIRHGYMTLVIRLGNLLEKHKEREPVQEYLAKMEESYHKFVTGELKIANDRNSRNLGG